MLLYRYSGHRRRPAATSAAVDSRNSVAAGVRSDLGSEFGPSTQSPLLATRRAALCWRARQQSASCKIRGFRHRQAKSKALRDTHLLNARHRASRHRRGAVGITTMTSHVDDGVLQRRMTQPPPRAIRQSRAILYAPSTETHAETAKSALGRAEPRLITSVHTPHVRPVAVHAGLKLGQRLRPVIYR